MTKTIVLDGIEYLLVPKEVESAEESPLGDFLAPPPVEKQPEPSVQIIDASAKSGFAVAQPKPYSYREKFVKKELTAGDLIAPALASKKMVADFKDLEVFNEDKLKPEDKRLFYGPGIEVDSV